jgi:hypothetical protein
MSIFALQLWVILLCNKQAIDISKKKEKGLFGKTKVVPRSKKEQRKLGVTM